MKVQELKFSYKPSILTKRVVNKNIRILNDKLKQKRNENRKTKQKNIPKGLGQVALKYIGDINQKFGIATKKIFLPAFSNYDKVYYSYDTSFLDKENEVEKTKNENMKKDSKYLTTENFNSKNHPQQFSLNKFITITDYQVNSNLDRIVEKKSKDLQTISLPCVDNESKRKRNSKLIEKKISKLKSRTQTEKSDIIKIERFNPYESDYLESKIGKIEPNEQIFNINFQNKVIKFSLESSEGTSSDNKNKEFKYKDYENKYSTSKIPITVRNIYSNKQFKSQGELLNPERYDKKRITVDDYFSNDIHQQEKNMFFKSKGEFFKKKLEENKSLKILPMSTRLKESMSRYDRNIKSELTQDFYNGCIKIESI